MSPFGPLIPPHTVVYSQPSDFVAPLFSYSYKPLFPQLLSFHIHTKPRGCGVVHFQFLTQCLCASVANPAPKSCRVILLQTLCRSQKSQLLCNQANPNSLRKMRGVGCASAQLRALCVSALSFPFDLSPCLRRRDSSSTNSFRINTCKSVSKQTTLSSFRINTYEKQGEGGIAAASCQPRKTRRLLH